MNRDELIKKCAEDSCWSESYVDGAKRATEILDCVLPKEITLSGVLACIPDLAEEPVRLVWLCDGCYREDDDEECDDEECDGEAGIRVGNVGLWNASWVFWNISIKLKNPEFRDYMHIVRKFPYYNKPSASLVKSHVESLVDRFLGADIDQSISVRDLNTVALCVLSAYESDIPAEIVTWNYLCDAVEKRLEADNV